MQAWKFLIPTRQLTVLASQSSIPKHSLNVNLVSKSIRDDDIQVLRCSGRSPDSSKNSPPEKLNQDQLKEREIKLCNLTDKFFHQVKFA